MMVAYEPMPVEVFCQRMRAIYGRYGQSLTGLRLFLATANKGLERDAEEGATLLTKLRLAGSTDAPAPTRAEGEVAVTLERDDYELLLSVMEKLQGTRSLMPRMLVEMAHIYAVAFYDAYMVDVFDLCLRKDPRALATRKKAVTYERLVLAASLGEIIDDLIEAETGKFAFLSASGQLQALGRMFGLRPPDAAPIDAVACVRERRNLLTHNGGVVSRAYLDATDDDRWTVAQRLELTLDDLHTDLTTLALMGREIGIAVRGQFAPQVPLSEVLGEPLWDDSASSSPGRP